MARVVDMDVGCWGSGRHVWRYDDIVFEYGNGERITDVYVLQDREKTCKAKLKRMCTSH